MKNYLVIRMCNKDDGTMSVPLSSHEREADAWKEFYRLCMLAVDSAYLVDTVVLLAKDGFELDCKTFNHPAPEEDEPNEEPEEN